MANPVSPQLNRRTTLKDALSMMLDADVQTGIVVDRTGAVQGLLTFDTLAAKMREGEHAPALVDAPTDAEPPGPSEAELAVGRSARRAGPGHGARRARRPEALIGHARRPAAHRLGVDLHPPR